MQERKKRLKIIGEEKSALLTLFFHFISSIEFVGHHFPFKVKKITSTKAIDESKLIEGNEFHKVSFKYFEVSFKVLFMRDFPLA